jgi:epoxide hydrolase-like predicted phosphatase
MIEGVIFDVGGVLVRTHDQSGRRKWEKRLGLEPGRMAQLVFDSQLGRQAQLGQATLGEIWDWLGGRFGLNPRELVDLERDFWAGDRVDRDLCNYIRDLRAQYRTGLLSNTWARDGRAMAEGFGFAESFEAFVTSAEIGVMKPDPRIYHVILERLGLVPAAAIFVDDFVQNVEAARELGMQAIHFDDPVRLQSLLEEQLGV